MRSVEDIKHTIFSMENEIVEILNSNNAVILSKISRVPGSSLNVLQYKRLEQLKYDIALLRWVLDDK